ncbi:MAG: tRNA (N6-isopentenyl adenosine(37)-C2)-methylthiotransferase MiaB [bacterium]
MKAHIRTYGCQMNVRDSEAVSALLLGCGYEIVQDEAEADVIIVNTCSVRDNAENKALGKLRELIYSRRDHPGRIVGAIGCMAQRAREELFTKAKGLDFAIGPRRLASLPSVIETVRRGEGPVLDVLETEERHESLSGHSNTGVTAFVTVVEGCSRGCTYCVVPAARGPETSRPIEHILTETRSVVSAGAVDITLLGQSVASYGRRTSSAVFDQHTSPLGLKEPFPRLLESVSQIPGIKRLRFISNHPSGITDELITVMRHTPSVCEHIHLPLQSGSDRLLGLMNRGYSVAEYRDAVHRLRSSIPGLAVTTDIIVGFPTETESDFNATRSFMEEIQFDNSYIFKYSPRPRTTAARWPDDVSQETKLIRNRIILEDQDRVGLRINQKLIGHEVEVLIEGTSLRNSTRWSGRTRTGKIVIVEAVDTMSGPCMAMVRIERAMPQTLYGTVIRHVASSGIE